MSEYFIGRALSVTEIRRRLLPWQRKRKPQDLYFATLADFAVKEDRRAARTLVLEQRAFGGARPW